MKLSSGDITLRVPEPSDLSFMASIENNPDFWAVGDTMAPFSDYMLKKFIANGNDVLKNRQIRFIITSKNERVGIIDLFDWHPVHERASVGVLILGAFQRKGIAQIALNLAEDYATKKWMVRTLSASIQSVNSASIALFEKAGFRRCGTRNNWYKTPEGWQDEYLYLKSF